MAPGVNTYGIADREPGDYLLGVKASALKRFADFPNVNLVLNGGMEVSQEKVATAQTGIAGLAYIVDIFNYNQVGTGVVTLQQVADAPPGFKYSAKVSVTTADAAMAAADTYAVGCSIEGYRTAKLGWGAGAAVSVSLGFWVKTHRTGIYCINFRNSAFDRSYVVEYTVNVADVWEYKTLTVPGDTSGTWSIDNSLGILVGFPLAGGSNKITTAGAWTAGNFTITANAVIGVAATTDTFQITGVSLVPGSAPVPQGMSPYILRPFDEELQLCQRHYEKSFNYATVPAQNAGLNLGEHTWPAVKAGAVAQRAGEIVYRVRKRGFGNMTFYNPSAANGQVRDADASADCTGMTVVTGSESEMAYTFTGNASTAVGNLMCIHWVADARL